MKYIKLTDENMKTKDGFQYKIGENAYATGAGASLCTDGFLHVYDNKFQAELMRHAHVSYNSIRAFECKSDDIGITDGTKRGVKSLMLTHEIKLPKISKTMRVEISIRCVMLVYKDKAWTKWARNWLLGKDRTKKSADAAADAAHAARAAARAAVYAARAAADAAVYAADAAVYAADAADEETKKKLLALTTNKEVTK